MLFGISLTVWIVMLVCAVIAVLYVLIVDKKEGKRAEKRKYLATCVPTFGALNIPLMIGTIIIAQFI